ncbi:hypothetical protein M9458_035056, partial [Cirrhinus mrigala]
MTQDNNIAHAPLRSDKRGDTVERTKQNNTTSYPDDVLCSFYDASLNTTCRVPS